MRLINAQLMGSSYSLQLITLMLWRRDRYDRSCAAVSRLTADRSHDTAAPAAGQLAEQAHQPEGKPCALPSPIDVDNAGLDMHAPTAMVADSGLDDVVSGILVPPHHAVTIVMHHRRV